MKHKPLSERDKKLLLLASDRISEAIARSNHEDPNAVIAKVAAELKIKPGHIKVLVHGYNSGRTELQRKTAEDIYEKSAEFRLADTQSVLDQLYVPKRLASDFDKKAQVVSLSYDVHPTLLLRRSKNELAGQVLAGQALEKSAVVRSSIQTANNEEIRRQSQSEAELRQNVQRLRVEVCRLEKQALDDLRELRSYFVRDDALPWNLVTENCTAVYGPRAARLLSAVVSRFPKAHLEKQARQFSLRSKRQGIPPVDWTAPPYVYVDRLLKVAQQHVQAVDRLEQLQRRLSALYREKKAGVLQHPRSSRSSSSRSAGSSVDAGPDPVDGLFQPVPDPSPPRMANTPKTATWKSAGVFTTTLAGTFGGSLGMATGRGLSKLIASPLVTSKDEMVQDAYSEFITPDHEDKLRSISTKSLLTDLMANDDVISNYSPKEVVQAYNEIYDLAPRVANTQMIVRSYLRKRLQQGSFDQFDVDNLLKAEESLAKRRSGSFGRSIAQEPEDDGIVR